MLWSFSVRLSRLACISQRNPPQATYSQSKTHALHYIVMAVLVLGAIYLCEYLYTRIFRSIYDAFWKPVGADLISVGQVLKAIVNRVWNPGEMRVSPWICGKREQLFAIILKTSIMLFYRTHRECVLNKSSAGRSMLRLGSLASYPQSYCLDLSSRVIHCLMNWH